MKIRCLMEETLHNQITIPAVSPSPLEWGMEYDVAEPVAAVLLQRGGWDAVNEIEDAAFIQNAPGMGIELSVLLQEVGIFNRRDLRVWLETHDEDELLALPGIGKRRLAALIAWANEEE